MHGGPPKAHVADGVDLVAGLESQKVCAVANAQMAEPLTGGEETCEVVGVILVGSEVRHRRASIASRGALEATAEGPPEGVGLVLVPMGDEALNRSNEIVRGGERGVLEDPPSQHAEPDLDLVHP